MKRPNKIEPFWEKSQRGFRLLGVKYLLIAAMLGLFSIAASSAWAQSKKAEGTVVSSVDKSPLPGVNVMIKGTTSGTTTNAEGKFSLNVAVGQELVFSFIGFESQSVKFEGQPINIQLKDNSQAINEVVVVGYGVQKKKLVTGATIQVKSDDIKSTNSMIVGSALQGKTPGVTIVQTSGQPGAAPKIVIRGVGTNQDSGPLYVVDGVPTGDINFLNPNDIESVDVLKDAASTAIYGARASNGIILVTTKKGSYNNKMTLSYDGSFGVQNLAHKVQMANAAEYATLINESNYNVGKAPAFTDAQIAAFKSGNTPFGTGTDWQDEIFKKDAPFHNHVLGITGGNEGSMYSSSLSYSDQKGLIGDKSDYQRISFRFNSEHKVIKDFLKFGQNLTYTNTVDQGVNTGSLYNNTMRGMFLSSPLCPVYDPSTADGFGRTIYSEEASSNPVAALYFKNQTKKVWDRVLGNAYLDFDLLKGLKFKTTLGLDLSYGTENTFIPKYSLSLYDVNSRSRAYQGMSKSLKYTIENVLTYDYTIGKHSFKALAGNSIENTNGFYVNGSMEDLILLGLPNAVINNGTNQDTKKVNGSKWNHRLASFFGRLNYNYDEKYLLMVSLRRDGSSNFLKHWGNFTAVSLGWNISNESFMEGTKDWLSSLKIRGGWGQNGNQNVPVAYPYAALINQTGAGYYFDGGSSLSIGGYLEKIPNPNLVWETAEEIGAGLDAVLFNKLNFTLDFYKKTTKDWILSVPVPAIVGTGNPTLNGGDVVNKGFEVSLGYHDKIGELGYNVSANLTYNKNEMTNLANKEGIIAGPVQVGSSTLDEMYRIQEGHSIGFFYGLKTDGIFQNEAEVKSYKSSKGTVVQPNAKPGDVRFVDQNGDGVIDKNDKIDLGSYLPKYTTGFNIGLDYKRFDLSVNIFASFGNKIANFTRPFDRGYYNYSSKFFDRWHGEGTSNKLPRLTDGAEANGNWTNFSDLYLEDGDYVRIKNLNLGYTIFSPSDKKKFISQLRVFVSATNLYTFTDYTGLDPEIASGAPDSWAGGVDIGFYPQPRTFMVGLSVKF